MDLQQLQDSLEKGFYIDNLCGMASLCKSLALDSDYPVPFFVVQQVLLEIARGWEERPLPVDEAESLQDKMIGPLTHLVNALRLEPSKETVYDILGDIVTAYLAA